MFTVDSLNIENFKSILSHKFRLSKLNLFLGKNGLGKSSTLQTILLLRQSAEFIYHQDHTKRKVYLKGKLINLGNSNEVFTRYSNSDQMVFSLASKEKTITCRIPYKSGRDSLEVKLEEAFMDKSTTIVPNLLTDPFQYLGADRISQRDLFDINYTDVENEELGNSGENTVFFLYQNQDRIVNNLLVNEDAGSSRLIDQVSHHLSQLGQRLNLNVSQVADRISLDYNIYRNDGLFDTIKPKHTGFGLTYCLPVLTSILSGSPGKIQLIENPESHLHPRGQASIGILLAKAAASGQQLFIETHSDHIINGIRVAVKNEIINPKDVVLHFFGPTNKYSNAPNIYEINIDKHGELSDYPEGLLDEWQNQLINLI